MWSHHLGSCRFRARPLNSGTLRSLRHRNYRLYVLAQAISASGRWIQLIAENWLVVQLGGGAAAVGITTALNLGPLVVLGPFAGVLVDRANVRRLLIVTQSTNGLLALALGLIAFHGSVQIWMVWATAVLVGCVNSVDNPGTQAFTKQMVGGDDVANATALNTAIAGGARAIGPAIGGFLLAGTGAAGCFLINAASYGAVVGALWMMDKTRLVAVPLLLPRRGQVGEVMRYVIAHGGMWAVLLILAIVNTFGLNYQVLLSVLVAHSLRQGPASYGIIMSALGVGWLAGSLIAAGWTKPTAARSGVLAVALGIGSAVVGGMSTFLQTVAAVAAMGVITGLFLSSSAGYLQLKAPEDMRGRVMALYFVAFLGVSVIGGPVMGWVAESLGARTAFLLAAVPCVAAGVWVGSRSPREEARHAGGENYSIRTGDTGKQA
jgi:MFS family permease